MLMGSGSIIESMRSSIRNLYFFGLFIATFSGALGMLIFYASNSSIYISAFLIMLFLLGSSINQVIFFVYTKDILSEKALRKRSNAEINTCRVIVLVMSFVFFTIFCYGAMALMTRCGIIPLRFLDYGKIVIVSFLIAALCSTVAIALLFLLRKKKGYKPYGP